MKITRIAAQVPAVTPRVSAKKENVSTNANFVQAVAPNYAKLPSLHFSGRIKTDCPPNLALMRIIKNADRNTLPSTQKNNSECISQLGNVTVKDVFDDIVNYNDYATEKILSDLGEDKAEVLEKVLSAQDKYGKTVLFYTGANQTKLLLDSLGDGKEDFIEQVLRTEDNGGSTALVYADSDKARVVTNKLGDRAGAYINDVLKDGTILARTDSAALKVYGHYVKPDKMLEFLLRENERGENAFSVNNAVCTVPTLVSVLSKDGKTLPPIAVGQVIKHGSPFQITGLYGHLDDGGRDEIIQALHKEEAHNMPIAKFIRMVDLLTEDEYDDLSTVLNSYMSKYNKGIYGEAECKNILDKLAAVKELLGDKSDAVMYNAIAREYAFSRPCISPEYSKGAFGFGTNGPLNIELLNWLAENAPEALSEAMQMDAHCQNKTLGQVWQEALKI